MLQNNRNDNSHEGWLTWLNRELSETVKVLPAVIAIFALIFAVGNFALKAYGVTDPTDDPAAQQRGCAFGVNTESAESGYGVKDPTKDPGYQEAIYPQTTITYEGVVRSTTESVNYRFLTFDEIDYRPLSPDITR